MALLEGERVESSALVEGGLDWLQEGSALKEGELDEPPLYSALSEVITVAAPASDFGFPSLFYTTYALYWDQDKQLPSLHLHAEKGKEL
jgi:hypothetical protein